MFNMKIFFCLFRIVFIVKKNIYSLEPDILLLFYYYHFFILIMFFKFNCLKLYICNYQLYIKLYKPIQ